jgi:hypothetical protein
MAGSESRYRHTGHPLFQQPAKIALGAAWRKEERCVIRESDAGASYVLPTMSDGREALESQSPLSF